jgi:hypothetical protein
MIEGRFNSEEIETLISILKDWSFADKESGQEYEMMSIDAYQIPEASIIPDEPAKEDVVNKTAETLMSIEVSKEGITEEAEAALLKLIGVHSYLIKKALGVNDLPLVYTDDKISFPWFKPPIDECERAAYNDFITHLVGKAKSAKSVYEPVMGKDDEKYMFSRFLYRIGIDGTNRKTRQILMRNLEGSAWKNLTWKKKKAEKVVLKEA